MSDPRVAARLFGRRKEQLAAARAAAAARDAMTQALYDVETKRRGAAIRAEFAAMDGSAEGRRLKADFEALTETLDALSQGYTTILASHETGDTLRQLQGAEAAFYAFRDRLLDGSVRLSDFEQRSAAQVARVEARFTRSRDAMRAAADEIAAARHALESAAAAGLRSAHAVPALAEAERRLAEAQAAADRYEDIDRVTAIAGTAVGHAREARRIAEELPGLRSRISTRLSSLRTRLEAVSGRAGSVEATLSDLRRKYTYAAFADLADASARLSAHTDSARRAMDEATRLADAQDWEAAADAVARASVELAAGDAAAKAVLDRASRLSAVAADPRAPLDRARFAVRDAQRLLLSRGCTPPAGLVRELDGLAARLDAAPNLLVGPHPDYWAYLQVLDGVAEGAHNAVGRVRQWIASQS